MTLVRVADPLALVNVLDNEVVAFLREQVAACEQAGIPRERLLVDPGFGFAKTVQHNLQLMQEMAELQALALPILIGVSRKSLFGKVLGARRDDCACPRCQRNRGCGAFCPCGEGLLTLPR